MYTFAFLAPYKAKRTQSEIYFIKQYIYIHTMCGDIKKQSYYGVQKYIKKNTHIFPYIHAAIYTIYTQCIYNIYTMYIEYIHNIYTIYIQFIWSMRRQMWGMSLGENHTHTHTHTHKKNVHIHNSTPTHTHTYLHTLRHTHNTHNHTHTHITHTQTHTHTHTHTYPH